LQMIDQGLAERNNGISNGIWEDPRVQAFAPRVCPYSISIDNNVMQKTRYGHRNRIQRVSAQRPFLLRKVVCSPKFRDIPRLRSVSIYLLNLSSLFFCIPCASESRRSVCASCGHSSRGRPSRSHAVIIFELLQTMLINCHIPTKEDRLKERNAHPHA
jgi:hypothetical protein